MARTRNRFSFPLIILITVVTVSVAIGGCALTQQRQPQESVDANGLPTSLVSAAAIDARSEAHLYFPGSTVLKHTVRPETAVAGSSPDSAYAEAILATNATDTQIRSWYASQLNPAGWRCFQSAMESYMSDLDAYRRGSRETFAVGIVTKSLLKPHTGIDPPASGTVYQVDYFIAAQGVKLGLSPATNPCS